MSKFRKLLHPDTLQSLKQSGYTQQQINWIGSLINRYNYLDMIVSDRDRSYHAQERHALTFILKKAIDFTPKELITGVLESQNDSKM